MLDLGGYNHSYAVELEKLRNYLAFFHKYVFCTFCKLCMFQGCFLCWYRYRSSLALKDHAEMWLVRGCPRVSAGVRGSHSLSSFVRGFSSKDNRRKKGLSAETWFALSAGVRGPCDMCCVFFFIRTLLWPAEKTYAHKISKKRHPKTYEVTNQLSNPLT